MLRRIPQSSAVIVAALAAGAVPVVSLSAGANAQTAAPGTPARNVILLQGDGMGTAQRELIRIMTVGKAGELAMNKLDHTGLVRTDPDDPSQMVTDSAAAATAFATGVKSYNGAIATGPDRLPRTTLLELAKSAGKATGLVTTSQVTDASPAAFGSHVLNRDEQSEIARQYIEVTKPDVILGGGEDFWLPAGEPGAYPDRPPTDTSERSQGTKGNLINRARELGYEYVSNQAGLSAASGSKLLGLFANQEMFEHRREGQGDIYDPVVPLKDLMLKALDVVSHDPDGFFLFVEEEGIDEMAHLNNTPLTVKSGKALDDTVAAAVEFQRTHPSTLILVVGDHATGGLAIENVDGADETGSGQSVEDTPFTIPGTTQRISVDWTTNQHTGDSTPVTASGPSSELFAGFIDNTDIFRGIATAARLNAPAQPAVDYGAVGGTVPATLALSLGGPAMFGAFLPGVERTYTATMTAAVTSTAGDSRLTIHDPSATAAGHLVNGAFALAAPVSARVGSVAFAPVSGAPLALHSFNGPTSATMLTLELNQPVGGQEALRTGAYGKTLALTLSTTSP
jgi:alkaline phosphatase